jgi:UDP-N-acetylmuramyl pentapeptide synthase
MTPLWTARAIAAACGGTASADFTVQGVAFDSREVAKGDLFVAMKGEATDGHKFIDKAIAAGAAGIICENDIDFPHIRVADSAAALNALGTVTRRARAATGGSSVSPDRRARPGPKRRCSRRSTVSAPARRTVRSKATTTMSASP